MSGNRYPAIRDHRKQLVALPVPDSGIWAPMGMGPNRRTTKEDWQATLFRGQIWSRNHLHLDPGVLMQRSNLEAYAWPACWIQAAGIEQYVYLRWTDSFAPNFVGVLESNEDLRIIRI